MRRQRIPDLRKRSAFTQQKYNTFLFGDLFPLFSGAFLFLLSTFGLVAFSAFPSFISTSFDCSSFPLLSSPLSSSSSSSFCTLASSSISDKQTESCYVIIEFQLDTQSNLHTTQLHKFLPNCRDNSTLHFRGSSMIHHTYSCLYQRRPTMLTAS